MQTTYAVSRSKQRCVTVCINILLKDIFCSLKDSPRPYSTLKSKDNLQPKLWKRVCKNDPSLTVILQSLEAKACISLISKAMDCHQELATELIKRDSKLIVSKSLLEKLKMAKANGFTIEDVLSNPSILHRSISFLKERFDAIGALQFSDSVTLHAMKLSNQCFQRYIQKRREDSQILQGFSSRVSFLAHLFSCDVRDATALSSKYDFLWHVSPALIKEKVELFLQHSVPPKFIRENIQILIHTSSSELDRRLNLLRDKISLNDSDIKLGYLLSCNSHEFSKSFIFLCKTKDALEGCRNKIEYLSFRLQCDEATSIRLINSRPISNLSEIKLKLNLDFFLHDLKVKPEFIINNKQLLNFSIKTLKSRWTQMCDSGYSDVSTFAKALALSNKKFNKKYGSCVFIDTSKISDE